MLNSLFLALSVSIDSFGIGLTYGIKNTKIRFLSMCLLILMSLLGAYSSFFIGKTINTMFSNFITQIISSGILIVLGIIIIIDPIPFDFDKSHILDLKEAFILGIALSLDSVCIGIGSSIGGFCNFSFPIFVTIFQLIFISLGSFIGKKISSNFKIPENYIKIISGAILITFGILKFKF